ncbi:MAG: hypothetical protein K2O58_07170 [Bacteroidales bacterium]|nr:hypothetical protein [Bacteroidales bacterium]
MKKCDNMNLLLGSLAVFMTVFTATAALAACSSENVPQDGYSRDAVVDVYEYAPAVVPSMRYSVKVDGIEAFVLPTPEHDVCIFGCDKTVSVTVNPMGGVFRIC